VFFYLKYSGFRTNSASGGAESYLGSFDVNSVNKIKITSPEKSLTVEKLDGKWRIREKSDYPADFNQLSSFLQIVRNIVPARKLEYGKEYWGKFMLLPPETGKDGGTLVEIFDGKGRLLSSFIAGKMHFSKDQSPNPYVKNSYPDGRYTLANEVPALLADPLEAAAPEPALWISRNVFSMAPVKSISSSNPQGKIIWTLVRKSPNATFEFAEGKAKADPKMAMQYIGVLDKIMFIDVFPLDSSRNLLINILGSVKVETFDGFCYDYKVGVKGRKYFLRLNAASQAKKPASAQKLKEECFYSEWIYEINPKLAEFLLVGKDAFLSKK
jgi:hypothetical protein